MNRGFSGAQGISLWDEVIGKRGEAAAAMIVAKEPWLHVEIVKQGSFVSMDLRPNRVRIWVDDNGIVKEVQIG